MLEAVRNGGGGGVSPASELMVDHTYLEMLKLY